MTWDVAPAPNWEQVRLNGSLFLYARLCMDNVVRCNNLLVLPHRIPWYMRVVRTCLGLELLQWIIKNPAFWLKCSLFLSVPNMTETDRRGFEGSRHCHFPSQCLRIEGRREGQSSRAAWHLVWEGVCKWFSPSPGNQISASLTELVRLNLLSLNFLQVIFILCSNPDS